eukprot:13135649-Alexandrium_andersonii.AAC.1
MRPLTIARPTRARPPGRLLALGVGRLNGICCAQLRQVRPTSQYSKRLLGQKIRDHSKRNAALQAA